jgi:hypothetical protein
MGSCVGTGAPEIEAEHLEAVHLQDAADYPAGLHRRGVGCHDPAKGFEQAPLDQLLLAAEVPNPALPPQELPPIEIQILFRRCGHESDPTKKQLLNRRTAQSPDLDTLSIWRV